MNDLWQKISEHDFMPHGHCYFWTPDILWTHVTSDFIIGISYYSIPLALLYFVLRRKDIPFRWIFALFMIFIFSCGTTHLLDVWTTWNASYRIEGFVKAFTAAISALTAVLLWKYLPNILSLPSPKQVEDMNQTLSQMAYDAQEKANQLEETSQQLERFNQAMLGREGRIIELKGEINQLRQQLGLPKRYSANE